MRTDVMVFQTGLLYEADMIAGQFEQLGIPYYRRMDSITGVEQAMPVMAPPGPGTLFVIFVPEAASEDAHAVINEMGLQSSNPCDVWAFRPNLGQNACCRQWEHLHWSMSSWR